MAWVRLCDVSEAPVEGQVAEADAGGRAVCLVRIGGSLAALDNLCPHRQGPLGQGWIENGAIVCPWHSWAFDCGTGLAEYPEGERVAVFPVRTQGNEVHIEVD